MNDKDIMRFRMDEAKILVLENSELWEFTRLDTKITGLPYDIYVDDNGAYKTFKHDLWLYVDVSGKKIPVTIGNNPVVKRLAYSSKIDFGSLYDFIEKNRKLLVDFANGKICSEYFFDAVIPVEDETKQITIPHYSNISEMATLPPERSGLSTTLWLDENELYLPHAPRIKFRADRQNKNTNNDPSMEIQNPDRIHNMEKCDLSAKELKQIKEFVKINQRLLLMLSSRKINYNDFKKQMIIVDENGNPKDKPIIGKFVNGFAIYQLGNKFNFMKKDGTFLFKEPCLDNATNFINLGNSILVAYVSKDGQDFYIDDNGDRVFI